jgi:hypothetical protein
MQLLLKKQQVTYGLPERTELAGRVGGGLCSADQGGSTVTKS